MDQSRGRPRGADIVVETLERLGVRRLFTLSGNHIMPIFDALLGTDIAVVHVRQEAACVHMADAWGRLTGEVGVALVTGGQGQTNGAAALFTALAAESPVLLLSGHAGLSEIGRGAFQELAQAEIARPIPICADESLHDRAGLDALSRRYDAINIKLDKAGGLTEAVMLAHEARARGFSLMIGCMVGTSLAMAPAMLLAHHADYVDLDGPLLLARDREPGLRFEGSLIHPPEPALWG